MEIGVDIVKISRFEELVKDKNFLDKNFTDKEIDYCNDQFKPVENFAVRFAGKEAVKKALSPFIDKNISFKNIEILNEENGNPYVNILSKGFEKFDIHVSLSHSKESAVGMAVVHEDGILDS